jgi:hypothetical protein
MKCILWIPDGFVRIILDGLGKARTAATVAGPECPAGLQHGGRRRSAPDAGGI